MNKLAVLGTGTMGQGIAQLAATSGFETRIYDVDGARATASITAIMAQLARLVQKGKLDASVQKAALERLSCAADVRVACTNVDVVIEAVPEDMALKVALFREVMSAAPPSAMLGSNTSSLSITELGKKIGAADRTVGLHFFNPPPVMELLEVVRGLATSQSTIERALTLARALMKTPIVVARHPGLRVESPRRDPWSRSDPHARVGCRERAGHRPRDGARLPPSDGPAQAHRSRRARRAPRHPRAPSPRDWRAVPPARLLAQDGPRGQARQEGGRRLLRVEGRATRRGSERHMRRGLWIACALACGGEAGSGAPPHPPPREVLALAVRVTQSGSDDAFCPALEVGLARSGIAVVSDASQPADTLVTCRVFMGEDDGFLRITSNGQPRMKITVRVEVRSAQNVLVDQFIAEYKGFRGSTADEDAVGKVVIAFAYSPRMAAFARTAKSNTGPTMATTSAPTAPVMTAQGRSDPTDDAAWFAIDTVKCKIPARVESCDSVRGYLRRHPNGAHAQEANDILATAQPSLERLQKEEVAWQKANRNECARMRSSDACAGVEAYEIQFPSGLHAEDAHRLLKAAGIDK